MSKANNLTDFLTDIANTIRYKKGYSSNVKINPQSFSNEISSLNIPLGSDGSWYPDTPSKLLLWLWDSREESGSAWIGHYEILYGGISGAQEGQLTSGNQKTLSVDSFLSIVFIYTDNSSPGDADGSNLELEIDGGECILSGSELSPGPNIYIVTVGSCRYVFNY